jgi:hypothetical protein
VQPFAVSDAHALMSLARLSVPARSPFVHALARASSRSVSGLSQRPSPSGLCSTRESVTSCRLFRPTRARASLGFHSLQGFPPLHARRTFTRLPLTGFAARPQATSRWPLRVSPVQRLACLFRDCRPSWASRPHDLPRALGMAAVRELPPQAPGCVTVPSSSHL